MKKLVEWIAAAAVVAVATAGFRLSAFWRAEAYHQHFYKTNAFQYRMYRVACGRDPRLADLWGKHH